MFKTDETTDKDLEVLHGDALEGLIEEDEDDAGEAWVYELGYLLVSSILEEGLLSEVGKLKADIEHGGGVFVSEEAPARLHLAYTMERRIEGKKEKFDDAYFGWIKFEMTSNLILALKETLDANRNLLRYMIIKTVKENTRSEVRFQVAQRPERKVAVQRPVRKEESKGPISEAELDRTIEELVVE